MSSPSNDQNLVTKSVAIDDRFHKNSFAVYTKLLLSSCSTIRLSSVRCRFVVRFPIAGILLKSSLEIHYLFIWVEEVLPENAALPSSTESELEPCLVLKEVMCVLLSGLLTASVLPFPSSLLFTVIVLPP